MLRIRSPQAAICALTACVLSACGSGAMTNVAAPPHAPAATTAVTRITTSTAASTQAIAPLAGFSGALALPPTASQTTITAVSSTTAPAGAYTASNARTPQSGTLTFYFFLSLTPGADVSLPGLPGVTLTLPPTIPTAGRDFFYAISDPTLTGVQAFRTEGPAHVSGQTLTFDPTANPVTLIAGKTYVLTFYASSVSGTVGVQTIAIPNVPPASGLWAYDISAVDPARHAYYLADRTNASLDVVDTSSTTLVAQIKGFVGFTGTNATSGPDGVVPIPGTPLVYVGDGMSRVQLVNVDTKSIVTTISTALAPGDALRADEGSYDPDDGIVAIANNADTPPFLTFISTKTNTVIAHAVFTGATGIEQSQYDPGTKLFFVNVVGTPANPGGEVDTIAPASVLGGTPVVTSHFPLTNCSPTGMAIGLNEQLLIGCSPASGALTTIVLDATTGAVVTTIPKVGGADEVWFDPSNQRFYVAANGWTTTGIVGGTPAPVLGVIDATTLTWLQNVPTDRNSHSVAADPVTNHVFVPLSTKGLGVFSGF